LTLVACAIVAAPASARVETVSVIGTPQAAHGATKLPVLRSTGPRGLGCRRLRQATLVAGAAVLRRPRALRPGDRIRVRRSGARVRSLRVTRRSGAPSFARVAKLIADTRAAAERASRDVAAIAALPADAAGQRNFASAEQARALGERLNTLDEQLGRLAAGLDAAVASIDRAFGSDGRRCRALRRVRDARTKSLRETAAGARTASRGLQAGVSDIDRLLSFLPPEGVELPFGTVGTVGKLIEDLLNLLSNITGGTRDPLRA
jgi:hypothetical protein